MGVKLEANVPRSLAWFISEGKERKRQEANLPPLSNDFKLIRDCAADAALLFLDRSKQGTHPLSRPSLLDSKKFFTG